MNKNVIPVATPIQRLEYASRSVRRGGASIGPLGWAVLVCILVVLGLTLIPAPCVCDKTAKINMVKCVIGESGTLTAAIEHYRYDVGEWPASLDDLCLRPTGRSAADNWAGPYIDDPSGLSDPWGNPYRLDAPGRHRVTGYDLWSAGPDGRYGTADDIANWTESSRSTISPP